MLPQSQKDFTKQVVTAFLEADISLYKLQHFSIENLFNSTLGHHCPSESACRKQVNDLASQESERIEKLLTRKPIFLVVDESYVSGQKYINVLAGPMEEPNKTHLIACSPLSGNPNSSKICRIVDDCLKEMGITREMFLLLLSDAVKYTLKAGDTLKIMYQRLLHVTCTAHFLLNRAERIRAHFKATNNLISSIKAATIKNKDRRRSLFTAAGLSAPPQLILTRWGTWLEASFFYAENFEIAKQIVSSFEDGGKLVERAKEAIADQDVFSELRQIFSNYREIAVLIKEITNSLNTIVAAVEAIQNLCSNDDPCQIKQYIQKRLAAGSDILKIADGSAVKLPEHSPAKVAQPTSASVERCFSILKNLLSPGRNFDQNNVYSYLVTEYNCTK